MHAFPLDEMGVCHWPAHDLCRYVLMLLINSDSNLEHPPLVVKVKGRCVCVCFVLSIVTSRRSLTLAFREAGLAV